MNSVERDREPVSAVSLATSNHFRDSFEGLSRFAVKLHLGSKSSNEMHEPGIPVNFNVVIAGHLRSMQGVEFAHG